MRLDETDGRRLHLRTREESVIACGGRLGCGAATCAGLVLQSVGTQLTLDMPLAGVKALIGASAAGIENPNRCLVFGNHSESACHRRGVPRFGGVLGCGRGGPACLLPNDYSQTPSVYSKRQVCADGCLESGV